MEKIVVTENEANQRLDRFLKKYFKGASLSHIYKMIRKDIKVNGKRAKAETLIELGDEISLYLTEEQMKGLSRTRQYAKAKRQFRIAYEDPDILIVEKPFGLLVHGDKIEKKNTLTNQVISYLIDTGAYVPRVEKTFVPSPVNRLDRNTTGLVIFGKTNHALQELNQMMRSKEWVEKYYWTIVKGELKKELHLKDRMEKDHEKNRIHVKSIEGGDGKIMETIARPVVSRKGYTLAEVQLITGRTHQIRAHLKKAGYPVIGDDKYGNPEENRKFLREFGLKAQFLHAYKLKFAENCPLSLNDIKGKVVTAELPGNLQDIKDSLFGKEYGSEERGRSNYVK